eukprot:TRINITY_DN2733_c0_g1_i3.p1 TRINITY_DN2733_c0_g1~~TRINITY_DN2733_c0_g1_i3.p1  ORF type:complete len:284 (-),score=95.78 TRINITY_DN2733_c0_g1_i3:73-924(-)
MPTKYEEALPDEVPEELVTALRSIRGTQIQMCNLQDGKSARMSSELEELREAFREERAANGLWMETHTAKLQAVTGVVGQLQEKLDGLCQSHEVHAARHEQDLGWIKAVLEQKAEVRAVKAHGRELEELRGQIQELRVWLKQTEGEIGNLRAKVDRLGNDKANRADLDELQGEFELAQQGTQRQADTISKNAEATEKLHEHRIEMTATVEALECWLLKVCSGVLNLAGKCEEPESQLPQSASKSVRSSRPKKLSLIHISEPTRLLSISYAVFCLKKKNKESVT